MSATLATEDILIIETPERVPLHFALASIGNRFLACALDHALQALTIILMFIAFTVVANYSSVGEQLSNAPKWVKAALIIVVFLIISGYFAFFEWIWNGQTPGKRLLKLRVIREDGRPITFWEAAVRNLLRTFRHDARAVLLDRFDLCLSQFFGPARGRHGRWNCGGA